MATTLKNSKTVVGINEEIIELNGAELNAFEADRKEMAQAQLLLETEYKAKQEARDSAIKKLAEIAGLTKEEINAIL